MIFSTYTFLAFFCAVFLIQWFLLPALSPAIIPERYRLKALHLVLLVASYIFYMFSVWEYGLLIAASTLLDYGAGLLLARFDWALAQPPAQRESFGDAASAQRSDEERAAADGSSGAVRDWHARRAGKTEGDFARAKRVRLLVLLASLGMNLGMLAYFKYADFFIESAVAAINSIAPGTIDPATEYSLLLQHNDFHCDCEAGAWLGWVRQTRSIRDRDALLCEPV